MTPFTSADYLALHRVVFALDMNGKPRWPGYRPEVVEIPNGDGRADAQKRYAHVKTAYRWRAPCIEIEAWGVVGRYFERAFARACEVAVELGIPPAFWPAREACALRVLEYPPMVGGERHTDFDLFTLNLYRSDGGTCMEVDERSQAWLGIEQAPEGVHLGELYDLITGSPSGREQATVHRIDSDTRCQFSLVFFALPSHTAVLPDGRKVGDWLSERYARSRVAK